MHIMAQLARIARTLVRISRTRYPAFIAGLPLWPDEVPVFTYHDVAPAQLESDLEFLRINGYRALGLDEFLLARAQRTRPGRSVLLTFDDARKSFWNVVLPLLRAFDTRAVLFAPTYWMDPPGSPHDDLFMDWEQLRTCVQSGFVDVQSHAHRHALVYIAPQIAAFATPATLARYDIYDWPMRRSGGADLFGRPPLGAPIYRAAPLLAAQRRYLENESLTQACADYVATAGGDAFFEGKGWARELRRVHDERSRKAPGRYMQETRFRLLVESEFERSRAAFEAHLGYSPKAIAYPWSLGSMDSLRSARRFGLRAAFGVGLDYRAERRGAKLPIPVYGRLKCDWLQFLPGAHRSSLLVALRRKIAGFADVQHLAH